MISQVTLRSFAKFTGLNSYANGSYFSFHRVTLDMYEVQLD